MAKSDLLKQAIADAKTVKETALANAKIALQEAFAPRLERMLATKLTNEIDGEEEAPAAAPAGEEIEAGVEETDGGDDFTWTDDTLAASVGGNDYSFQVGMAGEEDEEVAPEPEAPASEEEMTAEYTEGVEDDLELESIIRELEGDLEDEDGMMVGEGYEEDEDDMMVGEGYEEDEDDMMVGEGYEEDEDASIDEIIEAILREEGDVEGNEFPEDQRMDAATMTEDEVESMAMELDDTKSELEEAYRTVKQLKSIINEVNLLNAKLLYTNKLFRNFELNEAQKMKVIENFDRAGNTREVKLVFSTLAESFNRPTKKRVVKESIASKPIRTTAPSVETTQVLSEGFELANRWKKLAGLL
jgi:hypothetical protein